MILSDKLDLLRVEKVHLAPGSKSKSCLPQQQFFFSRIYVLTVAVVENHEQMAISIFFESLSQVHHLMTNGCLNWQHSSLDCVSRGCFIQVLMDARSTGSMQQQLLDLYQFNGIFEKVTDLNERSITSVDTHGSSCYRQQQQELASA